MKDPQAIEDQTITDYKRNGETKEEGGHDEKKIKGELSIQQK
jgi:hypothetical protein